VIWRDRAGFDRAAANYMDATARLTALAAANDTPGFSRQLELVNQACGSCHAQYKEGAQGPPQSDSRENSTGNPGFPRPT